MPLTLRRVADRLPIRPLSPYRAPVIAAGRKPRRRTVDLMIAAELPLYTTNPGDFAGLDHLVTVIPVSRPEVPGER